MTDDRERDPLRWDLAARAWAAAKAEPVPGTWALLCQRCQTISHMGRLVPIEGTQTLVSGVPSCRCPYGYGFPVLHMIGLGDPTLPPVAVVTD